MITTEFVGGDELLRALKDLGSEVAGAKNGGLVRNALQAAARDVVKRMIAGAPESEKGSHIDWHLSENGKWTNGGPNGQRAPKGRLKRSIFKKVERNPHKLNEIIYVGPRAGADRNDPKGAWYASLVEFQGGAGGKGQGFMRNSIKQEADSKTIARSLSTGIIRVANKIGNENARAVALKVRRANKAKKIGTTQALLNWRPPG